MQKDLIKKFFIKNENLIIIVLLSLGFLIRLLYIFHFSEEIFASDGISYISIAKNFLEGRGLINSSSGTVSILPPVYPLFISLFLALINKLIFLRIVQVIFSTITLYLIYKIATNIANKRVGLLALILSLFYPSFVLLPALEITETLYTFLLVFIIWVFVKNKNNFTYKKAAILGFLIGILTLIRANFIYFPFVFLWYFIFFKKNKLKEIGKFFIILICTMILPLIWGGRNQKIFGDFIITASYGGQALYLGNNEYTIPTRYHNSKVQNYNTELLNSLSNTNSIDKDKILNKYAQNYIIQNPITFIKNSTLRYALFWIPTKIAITEKPFFTDYLYFLDYFLVFIFLFALFFNFKKIFSKSLLNIIFTIPIVYGLAYAVTIVTKDARYRSPIMPFVIIISSYFIMQVFDIINKKFSNNSIKNDKQEKDHSSNTRL